jgi:plasmid stabilization system protein ParE
LNDLVWSPEALTDLEDAVDYLVERSAPAAERLVAGVLALVRR